MFHTQKAIEVSIKCVKIALCHKRTVTKMPLNTCELMGELEFNQQNEKKALKCASYMLMCVCVYIYMCMRIDLEWKIVNQIENCERCQSIGIMSRRIYTV